MEAKPNKDHPANPGGARPTTLGSTVRALTLAVATLTTGLIAGVFYAYEVSVNLGLAAQPDASYIATMNAIADRIENPLFFASFLGAVVFLLAALAAHFRRPRSGRFWLVPATVRGRLLRQYPDRGVRDGRIARISTPSIYLLADPSPPASPVRS